MDEPQRFLTNGKILSRDIDNFEEKIYEYRIHSSLGLVGGVGWHLILEKFSENGVDYLSMKVWPYFAMILDLWPKRLSTELAICVKNENPERWEKCQGTFEVEENETIDWKKFMRMDTILDPDSGFLTHYGALVVQVEIRVDYITDRNGIRIFNLFDPFKGSVLFKNNYVNFYVSKQLLMFHSPVIAEQLADGRGEVVTPVEISCASVHVFLQLIHGVKFADATYYTLNVLYLAHKYQVLTVLRLLEVYFNILPDNINRFYRSSDVLWTERVLGKNQLDEFQLVVAMDGKLSVEEKEKEVIAIGRKVLLAITRASFIHDLGPPKPKPKPKPLPVPSSSSFLHNLFESMKTITGCL